tara:strand:- start:300 stop:683 length:384 start_codon:yes stop_codon:yes gene_type:complete
MAKNKGYKKLSQKKLTPQKLSVGVVVVLLLLIFFTPSIIPKKIVEGNTSDTTIDSSALETIQITTDEIVKETNSRNFMGETTLDLDTITARLQHTTTENKSNKMQIVLLTIILIVTILGIITINATL